MPVTLYHFSPSPPSRSVLMTCRALALDVDVKIVNLFEKEQLKEDFVKINPQHCIPTLDDNGFVLWESRAINAYLASKYGKDDSLYPSDVTTKAKVDRFLYFDAGTLFPRSRAIIFPILFLGEKTISQDKKDNLNQALSFLETFLEGNKWVAGTNSYTIADIALYATISGFVVFGWNFSEYPRISQWMKDCEKIPGYQENQEGATIFGNAAKSKLNPGEI